MSTPPPADAAGPPGPEIDAALLDAGGRVAADVRCVHCRYNLRTLPWNARCPECNHPVAHSIRPAGLCYAPVAWLDCIRRGIALLLGVMGFIGLLVAAVLGGIATGTPLTPLALLSQSGWIVLLVPVAAVTGVLGVVLVTSPDPRGARGRRTTSAARITRYALASLPALAFATIAGAFFSRWLTLLFATLLVLVAAAGLPIGVLLTLRGLAMRVPAAPVAARAEVAVAVHAIAAFWFLLLVPSLLFGLPVGFLASALLSVPFACVAFILWIAILAPLHSAVSDVARQARTDASPDESFCESEPPRQGDGAA